MEALKEPTDLPCAIRGGSRPSESLDVSHVSATVGSVRQTSFNFNQSVFNPDLPKFVLVTFLGVSILSDILI